MIHAARGDEPLHTFNRFEFTAKELHSIVAKLCSTPYPVGASQARPGSTPDRADIIVAGALVLEVVAAASGSSRCVQRSRAARRRAARHHRPADRERRAPPPPRRVAIAACASASDATTTLNHSAHVAALALAAVRRHRTLHGLPPDAREYLEAGALLANVGLVISHTQAPPPQLLRDPQQRAHRADRHRDRDHRPDRPLPPQERAEGGHPSSRAVAASTRCW